jgi:hypothetical protein
VASAHDFELAYRPDDVPDVRVRTALASLVLWADEAKKTIGRRLVGRKAAVCV